MLIVIHGLMIVAKFGANQPIDGTFIAKQKQKKQLTYSIFTFEWAGFLHQRPCCLANGYKPV